VVGTIRVVSIPTVVVFPAPLGPRRPKISPPRTDRSRPSTAVTEPGYTLVSPRVRTASATTTFADPSAVAVASSEDADTTTLGENTGGQRR
jgi:hypothetical protein